MEHHNRPASCHAVIVFLKSPEKGRVKTRLSKVLDESFVLALYRGFIHDTLFMLQSFPDKFIYFLPSEKEAYLRSWLGSNYQYVLQTGRDLGEKMSNAFKEGFERGFDRLVLIGTDIPEITEAILLQAFETLETNDAVIGPATDGGYYLIGFRKESFSEEIFFDMNWSAGNVFQDTLKAMDKLNLKYGKVFELNDVDTAEDLDTLLSRVKNGGRIGPHTRKMIESYEN